MHYLQVILNCNVASRGFRQPGGYLRLDDGVGDFTGHHESLAVENRLSIADRCIDQWQKQIVGIEPRRGDHPLIHAHLIRQMVGAEHRPRFGKQS